MCETDKWWQRWCVCLCCCFCCCFGFRFGFPKFGTMPVACENSRRNAKKIAKESSNRKSHHWPVPIHTTTTTSRQPTRQHTTKPWAALTFQLEITACRDTISIGDGGVAQLVERILSMDEVLGSIPGASNTFCLAKEDKRKNRGVLGIWNPVRLSSSHIVLWLWLSMTRKCTSPSLTGCDEDFYIKNTLF